MKLINFICTCFCMVMVWSFASCTDEKEAPLIPLQSEQPKEVQFDIVVNESTVNSCTMTVTPSLKDVSYLCLYVTEDVFLEVPKFELKNYLMADLKKQAEVAGKDFKEFLQPYLSSGKKTFKIDHLNAGSTYELVVFAINGVTPAQHSAHQYFKTPLVDLMNCTFDVQAAQKDGFVYINVKPSIEDQYWFFSMVSKKEYDKVVSNNDVSDEDIVGVLFNGALQELKPQSIDDILNKLFGKGNQVLGGYSFNEDITEVVWLAILMKPINDTQVVFASNVSKGVINVKNLPTLASQVQQYECKHAGWIGNYLPMVHLVKP